MNRPDERLDDRPGNRRKRLPRDEQADAGDTTRSGDDPPPNTDPPPAATITGKSVGKLYSEVVSLWDGIR